MKRRWYPVLFIGLALIFCAALFGFACNGNGGTASFSLSNLSVSPVEVNPGEPVAISVYVSNTGTARGSYAVVLSINGVQEENKTVSLDSYQGQSVSFAVSKQSVNYYNVVIGNLSGSFTVITGVTSDPMDLLVVHFIDVGQADSILIDSGETEVLIDGGGRTPGVVDYLSDVVDGNLEVVVATHPHVDHIGGLIAVLEAFTVEQIWLNGHPSSSQTFADFMNSVFAEDVQWMAADRGDTIVAGELTFSVLNPGALYISPNNESVVLGLTYGVIDFLFTGDAEQEAEASMLAAGLLSEIEILKIGHHGSHSSSSLSFLNVVKPEVAVYMAGDGNSYGHPHNETLVALTGVDADIYGTDVHGNITITTDGVFYDIQIEKQAPPVTP